MDFATAFWHLFGFLATPLAVAAIAAAAVKLLWHASLRGVRWIDLAATAALAGIAVMVAGLVVTGHDGRMGTYAALVLAVSAAIAWRGWRR